MMRSTAAPMGRRTRDADDLVHLLLWSLVAWLGLRLMCTAPPGRGRRRFAGVAARNATTDEERFEVLSVPAEQLSDADRCAGDAGADVVRQVCRDTPACTHVAQADDGCWQLLARVAPDAAVDESHVTAAAHAAVPSEPIDRTWLQAPTAGQEQLIVVDADGMHMRSVQDVLDGVTAIGNALDAAAAAHVASMKIAEKRSALEAAVTAARNAVQPKIADEIARLKGVADTELTGFIPMDEWLSWHSRKGNHGRVHEWNREIKWDHKRRERYRYKYFRFETPKARGRG